MDLFSTGPFGLLPKAGDGMYGLPPGLSPLDDAQSAGAGTLAYAQIQSM